MSLSKAKQKKVDLTAIEATQRVMSFELASKKLSKGLGAEQAYYESERVLNLISGREIGVHLIKRYKYQIWVVYTVLVSFGFLLALLVR